MENEKWNPFAPIEIIAILLYLTTWQDTVGNDFFNFPDAELERILEQWKSDWRNFRYAEHDGHCQGDDYNCDRCSLDFLYANAERILKTMNTVFVP